MMKRLICLFGELTRKPEFFGFSATKKKKKYLSVHWEKDENIQKEMPVIAHI